MRRYALTGGIAAAVDLGVFGLLVTLDIPVPLAAVASFGLAAVANYFLTSRIVFARAATVNGFALFLVAAVVGLGMNVGVTTAMVVTGWVPPLGAKASGIGAAFFLNFALNATFVFGNGWANPLAGLRRMAKLRDVVTFRKCARRLR
jgi:putative flippase GtrA